MSSSLLFPIVSFLWLFTIVGSLLSFLFPIVSCVCYFRNENVDIVLRGSMCYLLSLRMKCGSVERDAAHHAIPPRILGLRRLDSAGGGGSLGPVGGGGAGPGDGCRVIYEWPPAAAVSTNYRNYPIHRGPICVSIIAHLVTFPGEKTRGGLPHRAYWSDSLTFQCGCIV